MCSSDLVDSFVEAAEFGQGSLMDQLLKAVRDKTQLDIKRADFKLDMVQPHLFMNYRVVDEHGRQLGIGRNLPALKAELGSLARGAFQALAALKAKEVVAGGDAAGEGADAATRQGAQTVPTTQTAGTVTRVSGGASAKAGSAAGQSGSSGQGKPAAASTPLTDWTFGELPELMEIQRGGHTLIGFPALLDKGTHVEIDIFEIGRAHV